MSLIPHCFDELINTATRTKIPYNIGFQEDPQYFVPHRHNFVEFSFIVKGCGSELVNNKRHELKPGTFSLLLPYQVHTINYEPDNPLSLYVGSISLETVFALAGVLKGLDNLLFKSGEDLPAFVHLDEGSAHYVQLQLEDMLEAYNENSSWGHLMFISRLIEILVSFDRIRTAEKFIGEKIHESGSRTDSNSKSDFWKIVSYIQAHYRDHITLGTLSQQFHLSSSYISSSFKRHIGENFLDFLNEIRIQNACALLLSTDLSIIEIASAAGYDSYATFSRAFHKHRGLSAKSYRKYNGKNKA